MSDPVLSGSARTVQTLRHKMRDAANIEAMIMKGVSPEAMKGLVAKPAFREAFGEWQDAVEAR